MSELPIRPESVLAATKAAYEAEIATCPDADERDALVTWEEWQLIPDEDQDGVTVTEALAIQRAGIAAFCEEEGLTVENKRWVGGNPNCQQRLVGKWRAVADD